MTKIPSRQGAAWNATEDEKLYNSYLNEHNISFIAENHQRSTVAIVTRLRRLGLIDRNNQPIVPIPPFTPYSRTSNKNTLLFENQTAFCSGKAESLLIDSNKNDYGLFQREIIEALKTNSVYENYNFEISALRDENLISIRLYNILVNMGINDIRDAGLCKTSELLAIPNFGSRTLAELRSFIAGTITANLGTVSGVHPRKIASHRTIDLPDVNWQWSEETIIELYEFLNILLSANLAQKSERKIHVLKLRLGLNTESKGGMTLEELGQMFNVSRERIRQLIIQPFNYLHNRLRNHQSCEKFRSEIYIFFCKHDKQNLAGAAAKFCDTYFDSIQAHLFLELFLAALEPFIGKHDAKLVLSKLRKEQCSEAYIEKRQYILYSRWQAMLENAIFLSKYQIFKEKVPDIDGLKRTPSEESIGRIGSFYSSKCQKEVMFESSLEYKVLMALEVIKAIVWYQEQPLAIPYKLGKKQYNYYPDLVFLKDDGKAVVVEVKPLIYMAQRFTIIKAHAALSYLKNKGIGYSIVDGNGLSIYDLAETFVPMEIENEFLNHIRQNQYLNYKTYKLLNTQWQLSFRDLASIIVRNDLAWELTPFKIFYLEPEYSFKPFLFKENR